MITKAKEISIEIKKESIEKYNKWKSELPNTFEKCVTLYDGGTYLIKAWYDSIADSICIFAGDNDKLVSSTYIVVGKVEDFKPGGYSLLPIRFSEEVTFWSVNSRIYFSDYRRCLATLNAIIGTEINAIDDSQIPF